MPDLDPSNQPPFGNSQFEAIRPDLTPEEQCLVALFDMNDVDSIGRYQRTSKFFEAITNGNAPEDLSTNIQTHWINASTQDSVRHLYPEGGVVIATTTIGFNSMIDDQTLRIANVDFLKTAEGVKAFQKQWFIIDAERVPRYVRQLDNMQLEALAADANRIAQISIDTDTERLKLGQAVEEAGPDGLRRFHVGDILTVMTGMMLSPRGIEAVYDLLHYMTNENPFSTQLARFSDECNPSLRKQFDDVLGEYYELPDDTVYDQLSLFRWLGNVVSAIGGDPLLKVLPIPEDQHALISCIFELELDYGPEAFEDKVMPTTMRITEDPEQPS